MKPGSCAASLLGLSGVGAAQVGPCKDYMVTPWLYQLSFEEGVAHFEVLEVRDREPGSVS